MQANIMFRKVYHNEGEVTVRFSLPEEILTIEQYGRNIYGSELKRFKERMHNKQLSPAYKKLFEGVYADLIELSEHINDTATKA